MVKRPRMSEKEAIEQQVAVRLLLENPERLKEILEDFAQRRCEEHHAQDLALVGRMSTANCLGKLCPRLQKILLNLLVRIEANTLTFDPEDAVRFLTEQLRKNGSKCPLCKQEMIILMGASHLNCVSLDRVNDYWIHRICNLRVICSECNTTEGVKKLPLCCNKPDCFGAVGPKR